MGWTYRKSLRLGPLRINLSNSGVGYSIGAAGLRAGISSTGRKYGSLSIPGTGLRYTRSLRSSTAKQGGGLFRQLFGG
jgi:hypothetical protein